MTIEQKEEAAAGVVIRILTAIAVFFLLFSAQGCAFVNGMDDMNNHNAAAAAEERR